MSALGQKQTYALQQAMSALHPIATAKAKFRKRPCLLYPPKADMCGANPNVRFGPIADINRRCVSTVAMASPASARLSTPLYAVGKYGWTSVQRDFDDCRPNFAPDGLRGGDVFGGRDVESNNCRRDCTLRLHFVRNCPLASLVARGNRRVVRGQRLSEDWSSPHCYERCRR